MIMTENRHTNNATAIQLSEYKGGVGFWGAVPALYDTSRLPMDRGIHVHARSVSGKVKRVDRTYSSVCILSDKLPAEGITVSEDAAIYYMISTVFGIMPQSVVCPYCSGFHLDEDWFSVHPHHEHVCATCASQFTTTEPVVGNPVSTVQESCGFPMQCLKPSEKVLKIKQAEFKNGLLVWGSNPALLWTGSHPEQEGMHVHAFGASSEVPELDETYGTVIIDGQELDSKMIRLWMAQSALPMLRNRVTTVYCPSCQAAQFDVGAQSYTPTDARSCQSCGAEFSTKNIGKVVSNPALASIAALEPLAVRRPQRYVLDLPERLPDDRICG
jgi:transposase-like protein